MIAPRVPRSSKNSAGARKPSSEETPMRLQDKVAIVTGAASGMGAATARLFASEGAKVVVADVLEVEGNRVADSIKSNRGEARFQRLDVASEPDWAAAVAATLAAYGKIDILINNAGVSGSDPDRLSLETWDRQMSINAKGVFLGMRAVIPVMQKAMPLGREGRVEEVAYANLFLASEEASYITGIELPVDGGFLAM